jgi:AcrR family transcriptional regulator
VDRAEKIEEIVAVGARVVAAGGYEALSFSRIADELGLARGAVYWYFPSKDELFAASAARAIDAALSHPPRLRTYVARIVWAVEQLSTLRAVHTTLQDRARHSGRMAALLEGIQGELRRRLSAELQSHVATDRLDAVTGVVFVFIQGLLAMPLTRRDRERHLRFLLAELADS